MADNIPVRFYKIADAKMLQFARTYLALFITDQAGFKATNPDFSDPFPTAWQAAIELAYSTPTDEVVVDVQSEQTKVVLDIMEQCRKKYRQVSYYAGDAFDEDKTILNEFGQDDYENIRTSQAGMVVFMGTLFETTTKYFAELKAKGFTAAMRDEIPLLQKSLSDSDVQQELQKKQRGTTAATRVSRMNDVWKFCQKVNRASKLVFDGDIAKLHQYLLPGSENKQQDLALTGTISAQATGLPIEGATATLQGTGLSAISDEFGVYAFTQQIPDGAYTLKITAAGFQDFTVPTSLTNGATTIQNAAMVV